MAAQLVGAVPAVVAQVAQAAPLHALLVGALELRERLAGARAAGAQRHVVLVRAVAAVVHAVAHLVPAQGWGALCSVSPQFTSLCMNECHRPH